MTAALLALLLPVAPSWEVNAHHTLVWEGKPWIPVGLEVEGSLAAVQSAVGSGVDQLLVRAETTVESWKLAGEALDKAGASYAVRPAEAWPAADAWLVAPQHLRRDAPSEGQMTISIAGASEVLAVLAINRDRGVAWSQRVIGNGGVFVLPLGNEAGSDRTLLLYPRFPASLLPDLHGRFDARRDALLSCFQARPWGAGLRAVVSPMGDEPPGYPLGMHAKDASPLADLEFAGYLEDKYKSLAAATRSWALATNDITDFRSLARLVPLWSQGRGVASLWDPDTEKLYAANDGVSSVWADVVEFREKLRATRLRALCANVRAAAGVPVVVEARGSADVGEDGVCLPVEAADAAGALDSVARSLAAALTGRPRMVWASPVRANGAAAGAVWTELQSAGVRGVFFAPGPVDIAAAVASAGESVDPDAAEWSPKAHYFPASMLGNLYAARVAGGALWLPSPRGGREVPFAGELRGYLAEDGKQLVLWREGSAKPVRLRVGREKEVAVHSLDGTAVKFKRVRNAIEFPLGSEPCVVSGFGAAPAPEESVAISTDVVTRLLELYGQWVDVAGVEKQRLRTTLSGLEVAPLAATEELDTQARRLTVMCAPYAWIPLESVESGNLATGILHASASFGRAAAANAGWPGQGSVSQSTWSFTCKAEGEFDVWLATDASPSVLSRLELQVAGTLLRPAGPAVRRFGGGIGWVPFGRAKVSKGRVYCTLKVTDGPPASFVLDSLFLGLPGREPSGRRPPTSFLEG